MCVCVTQQLPADCYEVLVKDLTKTKIKTETETKMKIWAWTWTWPYLHEAAQAESLAQTETGE